MTKDDGTPRSFQSAAADHEAARDAGRALLFRLRLLQCHFQGDTSPAYFLPRILYLDLPKLHEAAQRVVATFAAINVGDLAGRASSTGISCGATAFPSAHELVLEAAKQLIIPLKSLFLEDDDLFLAIRSLEQRPELRHVTSKCNLRYMYYWVRNWKLYASMIREIAVIAKAIDTTVARVHLECEYGIVHRDLMRYLLGQSATQGKPARKGMSKAQKKRDQRLAAIADITRNGNLTHKEIAQELIAMGFRCKPNTVTHDLLAMKLRSHRALQAKAM
jgi:hypothetical protein